MKLLKFLAAQTQLFEHPFIRTALIILLRFFEIGGCLSPRAWHHRLYLHYGAFHTQTFCFNISCQLFFGTAPLFCCILKCTQNIAESSGKSKRRTIRTPALCGPNLLQFWEDRLTNFQKFHTYLKRFRNKTEVKHFGWNRKCKFCNLGFKIQIWPQSVMDVPF